jgi:hypothetical protein
MEGEQIPFLRAKYESKKIIIFSEKSLTVLRIIPQ